MKLYEVYANNGLEYEDECSFTEIVVAKNEEDAIAKVINKDNCYFYDYGTLLYEVKHLDIVDGYKIILKPNDK